MSSQRGRGFARALARKCWVKKGKALFLAPQACAYPAEREERNNKKWFLMPVAPNTKLTLRSQNVMHSDSHF
jgi:hypothetical protein